MGRTVTITYGISAVRAEPGYLFRLTPSGSFTGILAIPLNTITPESLVQGTDGNFYGLTQGAGANGYGAFYQVTMAGQFTLLYSFTNKSSYRPICCKPATAISTHHQCLRRSAQRRRDLRAHQVRPIHSGLQGERARWTDFSH